MSWKMVSYHRSLFRWHCRNFFNYRRHLHPSESEYLEACFRLSSSYKEISEGGYEHFSYYTYSHRVKGSSANSSRLAYGSVSHPEEAYQAALPALQYRGLTAPESMTRNNRFYGLGWDIEENQFKLYFRSLDWSAIEGEFRELAGGHSPATHRKEALLSITYRDNEVEERKLYLYPLPEHLPNNVQGYARMMTDCRGEVGQTDLDPSSAQAHVFNQLGQTIIEKYQEVDEPLDTVAYHSQDDFTLYFP